MYNFTVVKEHTYEKVHQVPELSWFQKGKQFL